MDALAQLEAKTNEINKSLATHGISLHWGGDFSGQGNVFDRGVSFAMHKLPFIFPICLNNGYYNESQIENLARAIYQFGNYVFVFTTDGPAESNYLALGFPRDKAIRKARLEKNGLLNRFAAGLSRIGEDAGKKFFVFDWSEIYAHPRWQNENRRLRALYGQNRIFRADVEGSTREVLSHRIKHFFGHNMKPGDISNDAIDYGIHYTLDEIAFVAICDKLIGAEGVCYLYKESWPLFQKLADGYYEGYDRIENVGFLTFHTTTHADILTIMPTQRLSELSFQPQPPKKPHRPEAHRSTLQHAILVP